MSFFKKLFSSSYRQGVALEGAGRYREAAQHYLLAGERHHVARMHRLAARDEKDPYSRVDALRKALDFVEHSPEEPAVRSAREELRRELADALVAVAEHSGLLDRSDRSRLQEAAEIYIAQGAHNEAGEVFARLGFLNRAAESFKTAGNIGRMEEMFQRVEVIDVSKAAFDRAFDAYEFARMAGDPIGTIEALGRCVELRPQDAGLVARLQRLKERMPTCGRLTTRAAQGSWVLMGGQSLGIGREDENEILLLDPGVSRRHARIIVHSGAPVLEDLESSHGTFIEGRQIGHGVPLGEEGSFRIGKDVSIRYRFREGGQPPGIFEVTSGYLKGQRFMWTPRILTTGIPPDEPEWLPPGLALEFRRDYWHVVPSMCHGPVTLDNRTLTTPTILRIGDELVFSGVTFRVD